jgi:hypothetical protein
LTPRGLEEPFEFLGGLRKKIDTNLYHNNNNNTTVGGLVQAMAMPTIIMRVVRVYVLFNQRHLAANFCNSVWHSKKTTWLSRQMPEQSRLPNS